MTQPTKPSPSPNVLSKFFYEEAGIALGNKDAYTDVTIILSDDPERPEYRLHKMILSQDKTFCHLFEHEPKEVYEIGAVSQKTFEKFLHLMYGGERPSFDVNISILLDYFGCDKELAKELERLPKAGWGLQKQGLEDLREGLREELARSSARSYSFDLRMDQAQL